MSLEEEPWSEYASVVITPNHWVEKDAAKRASHPSR